MCISITCVCFVFPAVLDWAWIVLLFEIAIGVCAARLLFALAEADRECVVGSGSHAHSYQTVPSNGGVGSVASGGGARECWGTRGASTVLAGCWMIDGRCYIG